MKKIITGLLVLFLLSISVACAKEGAPNSPSPSTPATAPAQPAGSADSEEDGVVDSGDADSEEDGVEFTIVTKPLDVDSGNAIGGYPIPRGSTVHHYKNGIMKVFGPDGTLILKTRDSETPELPAPGGHKILATYQYITPNRSRNERVDDWTTKVYDENGELVLTVIDEIHKTR
ncbi:hypothetical protein ES703_76169 [subsurface metagenome]